MLVVLTPSYNYNINNELNYLKKQYNTYIIDYNYCNIELCNKLLELFKLNYKGNLNNNIISINNIIYDTLRLDSNYIYKILSEEFKRFICSSQYSKDNINLIIITGINDVFMYQEIYKNIYKKLSTTLFQYNFPTKNNFIITKLLFKNFNDIVPLNVSFKDSDFDNIFRYNKGKPAFEYEEINKHINILISSFKNIDYNNETQLSINTNKTISQNDNINDDNIVDEVICDNINIDHAYNIQDNNINLENINYNEFDQNVIENKVNEMIQNQFDKLINKLNDCSVYDKAIKAAPTVSSYALGKIGEKEVMDMINKIRPEFETVQTGVTGHMADIHAIDYKSNIKYILEIKLKQNLTQNDITKFNKDVEKAIKDNQGFNVIGIFISLNSDKIITIGEFAIDKNKIYLSNKYFSEQILDLIFTMTNTYNNINNNVNKDNMKVDYVIPNSVYSLIANLRKEYNEIEQEREIYNKMKENNSENIKQIEILINKLFIKQQFIEFIDSEFKDIQKPINDSNKINEEISIIKYIKETKRKNISKTYLLNNFPTLKTELAGMSLDQIINKYKNMSIIDNNIISSVESDNISSSTIQNTQTDTNSDNTQINHKQNTLYKPNNKQKLILPNQSSDIMNKTIYETDIGLSEVSDTYMMTDTRKARSKINKSINVFEKYNVINSLTSDLILKCYNTKTDLKKGNYKYCVNINNWLESYNNYLLQNKCNITITKIKFLSYLTENNYIDLWKQHYDTKGQLSNIRVYKLLDIVTNNKSISNLFN